ncbi:unnamed protein product [Rotaria magnacalcarata]
MIDEPQHYLYDTNFFTDKAISSSLSSSARSPSTPIPTLIVELPSSEQVREQTESITQTSSCSQMSSPHYQSSIDLMASTLKCDDCQTHGGLFQCCHCNQRLCIRCCNKHYKNVTVELERLHELSDRLVAKIVHTKNDLERQKNETLEQCHKWRLDTINTINKAHTLIIQTIHDEYETLGKEYELFVQKEMQHIHIDQNELLRMRKGNLSSVLSSSSPTSCSATIDSKNSIDTIRKRIEAFAKNIDETGKFLFQVKLPSFDIDDNLRVESRFGDATRSTSATWQNGGDLLSSSLPDRSIQEDESLTDDVQSTETDIPLSNNKNDIIININDNIEKESNKIDEQERDIECQTTNSSSLSSSLQCEKNNSNPTSPPSSRYALSVENDIELQQQQFYSPRLFSNRFDSAYCTAPSSPSNLQQNHYFSTSSLHEQPSAKCPYTSKNEVGSFYNNRRHTHAFQRAPSPLLPTPPSSSSSSSNFHNNNNNNNKSNDNEDTYRSVQHVQLKCEQDGSLEGTAIQIEQSHNTEGMMERRRTCMQACGVRRRTTIISPRSPTSSTSSTDGFSYDQPWLYYLKNKDLNADNETKIDRTNKFLLMNDDETKKFYEY